MFAHEIFTNDAFAVVHFQTNPERTVDALSQTMEDD